uniref:ETS domain-containing protein n=1 Tax=Cuerna arida TaxID=1464854 RepID=A0A1B6G342_9HEMI
MSNTTKKEYLSKSQLNDGNDSFDSEFDLLESTLSELKENEPQCDQSISMESYNEFKIEDITSKQADLMQCDNLELKKSQPSTLLPVDSSCSQKLEIELIESSKLNLFVSSTVQHLKSADCNLYEGLNNNNEDCRLEHLISDSEKRNSGCKISVVDSVNSTRNQVEIVNHDLKGHKNSDIVISNCDSSMEEHKELAVHVEKLREADMDLDVLNIECSPIPSPGPGSSVIFSSVECESNKIEKGPQDNAIVHVKVGKNCLTDEVTNDKPNVICCVDTKCDDILIHGSSSKSFKNDSISSESNIIKSLSTCSNSDVTSNQVTTEVDEKSNLILDNNCSNIVDEKVPKVEIKENNVKGGSSIYCSTPNMSKEKTNIQEEESLKHGTDFGYISPLDKAHIRKKMNLKRKNLGLECIEEIDECLSDIPEEKKLKVECVTADSNVVQDDDNSSAKTCFDTPAKSILKKWQPSCFSRSSLSGSFLILDECGENDEESNVNSSDEVTEAVMPDDFEVAYKSLTEELMKSSSNNIETLEKYHSQVQHENQMDDERFDEVIQELTLNYELDEKTSLACRSLECDSNEREHPNEPLDSHPKLEDKPTEHIKVTDFNKASNCSNEESQPKYTKTIQNTVVDEGGEALILKENAPAESSTSKVVEVSSSSKDKLDPSDPENVTIHYADGRDMTVDEEDFLLEEDTNSKKKPYEFFEFVSTDPQENEDNYNPEWQKLGQLTSDEERYRAVRDRWRSLVPPDPNRDLTCRQWRERNHKPPLNFQSLNNNHQMYIENERNQLCTAVFEMKIKKMLQELEDTRLNIFNRRTKDFQDLASVQDREQLMVCSRGGNRVINSMELAVLRKHHIQECCELKNRYDEEFKRISTITEEKIRILKNASEEVMVFQKFYRGVGAGDDKVCLYMTDIQVQELMETEQMLEQYSKFYQ